MVNMGWPVLTISRTMAERKNPITYKLIFHPPNEVQYGMIHINWNQQRVIVNMGWLVRTT